MKAIYSILFLLGTALLLGDQAKIGDTVIDASHIMDKQRGVQEAWSKVDPDAPISPLTSPSEGMDIGKVLDFEQFGFCVEIVNPTDQDIAYENVAINCSCTSVEIPPQGIIPSNSTFKIPMVMVGEKAKERGKFDRRITLFLTGYQPFIVNFTGSKSQELRLQSDDSDTHEIQYFRWLPIGYVPNIYEDWECKVDIFCEFTDASEMLKLGTPSDGVQLKYQLTEVIPGRKYTISVKPKLPLKFGPFRKETVRIPILGARENDCLVISSVGVVGSKLDTSAEYLPFKRNDDGSPVQLVFGIMNLAYKDRWAALVEFSSHKNPYQDMLKPLTIGDVSIVALDERGKEVIGEDGVKRFEFDGVTCELKDGEGCFWVLCTIEPDKISHETGKVLRLSAPGIASGYVTIVAEEDLEAVQAADMEGTTIIAH